MKSYLIDGNAQPMDEDGIARFVREQNIGLVGIGAMTRMVAKAYRMADAVRTTGVPVVMGGPHVTEMADEALGRSGGPRHADAVALGEADETWPKIIEDAANGNLKDLYAPVDEFGQESKPTLTAYPMIPWDKIDLGQFNLTPNGDAHASASWGGLGHISHNSDGIRARVPVRVRVLYGNRFLRRLHPVSYE